MCGSDCSCAPCQRSRVGEMVVGADGGLDRRKLNNRIHNLYHALKRAGIDDPAFNAWHLAWDKSYRTMSGPELSAQAETLARFMQTLGERAHAHFAQGVAVQGVSWSPDSIGQGFANLFSGRNPDGSQRQAVPREAKQVDDAISSVVESIAPVLPYGNLIRAAHDARRRAMYGDSAAPTASQRSSTKLQTAQGLSRGLRRGDPQATRELQSLRSRSRTDPEARKTLALVTVARRDDSARIERRYRGQS